jgi:CS domain
MASAAPVKWAQRRDTIYLSVDVPDVDEKKAKIELTKEKLVVECESKGTQYRTEIEFWAPINPEGSKYVVKGQKIEFILKREEEGDYWDKLIKTDGRKPHWLSCDWDKWVDEDESDDEGFDDAGMGDMGGMGGMPPGMGGMGGMPGMGGMGGDMGGMDFSQMMAGMGGGEGGMPDLSALGGMGGMGGMDLSALGGMGGMGDMDGGEDMPSLEDDMPPLEDDMPPLEDDAGDSKDGDK